MLEHGNDPERPPAWDIGRRGVVALAAFALLIAVAAAVVTWQSQPDAEPVDSGVPAPSSVRAVPVTSGAGSVVVAVSGRVRRPGLVRLAAGSRVADAIDAAGGVLPGTDLSAVNLARKVVDGELIAIGVASVAGGAASPGLAAAGLVNLNTATIEQLQTLPGVGPVLAQRIVDYREQHGPFASVGDLRKVSGIGDARFNDLKNRVTV